MQSSVVVAGMDAFELSLRKHFDTSGKSVALFHHRAICKTPMALPDNGRLSRRWSAIIAGKRLELASRLERTPFLGFLIPVPRLCQIGLRVGRAELLRQ